MVQASLWASSNSTWARRVAIIDQILRPVLAVANAEMPVSSAGNHHMDAIDQQILALLVEDGRRTYDDIARRASLSAPAVKRRVDKLRATGALRGFTAIVDHAAQGASTEALIELFFAPGTLLDEVATTLPR